jgi:hypothetical protein
MAKMWTEFLELFGPLMETLEQERPGAPAVVALRAVRAKLRAYSLEGPVDSGELTRLLKIVEEGLLAIEGGNWDWDGCRPGTSPRDKFWK